MKDSSTEANMLSVQCCHTCARLSQTLPRMGRRADQLLEPSSLQMCFSVVDMVCVGAEVLVGVKHAQTLNVAFVLYIRR